MSISKKPNDVIVAPSKIDKIVAVPHIGYHMVETSERLGLELLENIESWLDGKPHNVANFKK